MGVEKENKEGKGFKKSRKPNKIIISKEAKRAVVKDPQLKALVEEMENMEIPQDVEVTEGAPDIVAPPLGRTPDNGQTSSRDFSVSPLELAIVNQFLFDTYIDGTVDGISVNNYGHIAADNRLRFGGSFDHAGGWWFSIKMDGVDTKFFIQTVAYLDRYDIFQTHLSITSETKMTRKSFETMFKNVKAMAFNNSTYKGACIEVIIDKGAFQGIKKVEVKDVCDNLILSREQRRFINHFISRVRRGKSARVMFNGVPGTGKTESIRKIINELTPFSTFIIPIFTTVADLKMILECCEIFDDGVVIMDDIDLYIGSRDQGGYTNLLGEFLSFFDGVKKRKINLLASTNDKGLVDEAAERPGRFNFIIDFDYLGDDQVPEICDIHLDEQWRVKEVYDTLTGNIDGTKVKVTGAFIANLADNIREMALDFEEDDEGEWTLEDTLSLIKSSYKGFYSSQTKKKANLGFQVGK